MARLCMRRAGSLPPPGPQHCAEALLGPACSPFPLSGLRHYGTQFSQGHFPLGASWVELVISPGS